MIRRHSLLFLYYELFCALECFHRFHTIYQDLSPKNAQPYKNKLTDCQLFLWREDQQNTSQYLILASAFSKRRGCSTRAAKDVLTKLLNRGLSEQLGANGLVEMKSYPILFIKSIDCGKLQQQYLKKKHAAKGVYVLSILD
ncbi:hypothetical protein F5B18DRAFT_496386 [Nemania serpens]|nr:hypothetical protein F5B18DRAFT_496386 [Nemania serpens]